MCLSVRGHYGKVMEWMRIFPELVKWQFLSLEEVCKSLKQSLRPAPIGPTSKASNHTEEVHTESQSKSQRSSFTQFWIFIQNNTKNSCTYLNHGPQPDIFYFDHLIDMFFTLTFLLLQTIKILNWDIFLFEAFIAHQTIQMNMFRRSGLFSNCQFCPFRPRWVSGVKTLT